MDKYKNKYRIQSHRRPHWDYSAEGMYFITLVTQNRECCLGRIVQTDRHPSMELSSFGIIVDKEWVKSFQIRQELFCDEYIIMPNHLHAIVVLSQTDNRLQSDDGDGADDHVDGSNGRVETHGRASLQFQPGPPSQPNNNPNPQPNPNFIRKPRSISSFIAGFKSAVNSKIDDFIDAHQLNIQKYNRNNHFFQPNYNDHIIRNEAEYHRIKAYIINNPSKWQGDIFNNPNQ